MTLADWLANRWLVEHEPTAEETADLFAVVDRDLKDAAVPRLSEETSRALSARDHALSSAFDNLSVLAQ